MRYIITALLFILSFSSIVFGGSGELLTYQVDGENYEGYFVDPGKNESLVLLIHDWDGLTEYEVKRSDMLAEHGYTVFAADLFGKGVRPAKVKDKREHTGQLYKDRDKMRRLILGAIEEAKAQGADTGKTLVAGYCFGGAAVLEIARSGYDFKGYVTFHGGLSTPEGQSYSKTMGEILVMHGTRDKAITMGQFAALAKELDNAGVSHEMISYGGAEHAFTVFDGKRYQEKADKRSWARFLKFLEEKLK